MNRDRQMLERQHRLILSRAGITPGDERPPVDLWAGLRAQARAECARCCAQLRAENLEFFKRLELHK